VKNIIHEPYVSVIISIYNIENFIRSSLASVERQTLDNIEIICVDDGSMNIPLQKCSLSGLLGHPFPGI
jgi:cellulose synthase/poly-beta-1,6-N-acetylglucosamine synthase-like glycosyltransferase